MATLDEIYEKIKEYPTIILCHHTSPDPNAVGSQAGLVGSLGLVFLDKKILCAGENDEGDLIRVNKIDEVTPGDCQEALVITTDTTNTPRISNKNYDKGDLLIKINHCPDVNPYANVSYVDPNAPTTSKIVFDFLKAENLPITKGAATALYAGIVDDTGRFIYPEASTHTFDVAAELTRTGINIIGIAREVAGVTSDRAELQALTMDKMGTNPVGAAYTILMQSDLKKIGLTDNQADVAVSAPGRVKDVLARNVFVEKPDGTFRIHYRSRGPVISHLAEKYDGGGHTLAFGANAKDMDEIEQVFNEVVEVTKKYNEEHGTNK